MKRKFVWLAPEAEKKKHRLEYVSVGGNDVSFLFTLRFEIVVGRSKVSGSIRMVTHAVILIQKSFV